MYIYDLLNLDRTRYNYETWVYFNQLINQAKLKNDDNYSNVHTSVYY